MYFTMTIPDEETFYSKNLEVSTDEIVTLINILITNGGSFQLESGNYILFSRKIAENSIFRLYTE